MQRHTTHAAARLFAALSLSLLVAWAAVWLTIAHAQQAEPKTLKPGRTAAEKLAGGQAHEYALTLAAGQYAQLVLTQRGIDLTATLLAPTGQPLGEFDREARADGEEVIEHVAATAGFYRLRVQPRQRNAAPGKYELRLVELRPATDADRAQQQTRQALTESVALQRAGRYAAAIPLAERALAGAQQFPDVAEQTRALLHLAGLRLAYGQYAEAEPLYRRALVLRQAALGEAHPAVAAALTGLAPFRNA